MLFDSPIPGLSNGGFIIQIHWILIKLLRLKDFLKILIISWLKLKHDFPVIFSRQPVIGF
jgi:hypothetical protein